MTKKKTFIDSPEWSSIVQNVKGIMMSDSSMSALLDFERVLDDADLYAYKNWKLGELVEGPNIKKYIVSATFMWPDNLMPDPRGARRLLNFGCKVNAKKTSIKIPIKIKSSNDFINGTHYPRLVDKSVWIFEITIPKSLMNEIREGTVDIAGESIELDDLESAYEKDYDTADVKDADKNQQQNMGMPPLGAAPMGGLPPMPEGLPL